MYDSFCENEFLLKPTDDVVGVRISNALRYQGIELMSELEYLEESHLLRSPNFGRKSLNELKEVMGNLGLVMGRLSTPENRYSLCNHMRCEYSADGGYGYHIRFLQGEDKG